MTKKEEFRSWVMNRDDLQQSLGLKGAVGRLLSNAAYGILGLEKANRIQSKLTGVTGPEFATKVLEELGVKYTLNEQQLERIPQQDSFIIVGNHHYGSLDGMILEAEVGARRPDLKIMTTFLLTKIPGLKDCFIPVDNFNTGKARSFNGIRNAMAHIGEGHPLAIFPAGEVATWQSGKKRTALGKRRVVEDIPWASSTVKLIQRSALPVIPVYFSGENSRLFHILGKIHPRLRTIRLVREMFNKQGTVVDFRIGQPIPAEEIAQMDTDTLGRYLRNRCYALQEQCLPETEAQRHEWSEPVADSLPADIIRNAIASLSDKILFEDGDYTVYLLKTADAPNATKELFRLREETFRAVGEGSGNAFDTDIYDDYYYQLILWNKPSGEIAGAYRLGDCKSIIREKGVQGIYSASLYNYKAAAEPIIGRCIELGRSFVVGKYQREIHPLRLLLAGISVATLHFPDAEYFLGPVSMSNDYPHFYKSLAVHFIKRDFPLPGADKLVTPPHPFVPDFLCVNPDELLAGVPVGDIARFDRLMSNLSDGKYHLPVLFRKYFSCSARLACFNVDPDFSDSLDGLIFLKLSEFPRQTLSSILRGEPEELKERVFSHFYGKQ